MRSIRTRIRIRLASQLTGKILDCGAGEGLFGEYLRRDGNRVIALDIDAEALKPLPGTRVLASCIDTPFPDSYFDAVWACAIMEHVKEETMPEWVRITRPGGRIVAVTPNRRSPWDPLKRIFGLNTWWENEGHVRLYAVEELRFYGPVHGETWFVPLMGRFFWRHPEVSHVLIVDVRVTQALKRTVRRRFPELGYPKAHDAARICIA